MTRRYVLNKFDSSDYMTGRRATTLYYFNFVLFCAMPAFLLIYVLWLPHRLNVAAPPMIATWLVSICGQFLLRQGKLSAAGELLALALAGILIASQARKIFGEYATAYSSFIHLFPVPVLIAALFGKKRYIVPFAVLMAVFNIIFFFLIRDNLSGDLLIAAQVGMMSSLISLVLITSLLFFLRIVMDRSLAKVESANMSMRRFVPVEFLKLLNKEDLEDVKLGESTEREMTVLFSDIRNFSTISESMTPAENFSFINDYLRHMGPVIRQHSGFIDKYIGDAIMALFQDPNDALRAAQAMLVQLAVFNEHYRTGVVQSVSIGVGIHTGSIMLGTIGERMRMENTVISDAVNTASRIEQLNKKYRTQILISRTTLEKLEQKPVHRIVDMTLLKGRKAVMEIYEVLPEATEGSEGELAHHADFSQALHSLRSGDFRQAKAEFEEYLAKVPGDFVAKFHLQSALKHLGLDQSTMTLYEKYGRKQTVEKIVSSFYEKIIVNEEVADFFRDVDMGRLRRHQVRFIAVVLGAKIPYDFNVLQAAHARLPISMHHFSVVASLLKQTLVEYSVEPKDIDAVMQKVGQFARVIISQ